MGQKATAKIVRTPKQTVLQVRSPFLEQLFRRLSCEQYSSERPRTGTLFFTSPRENPDDPRIGDAPTMPGGKVALYKYYKLHNLPESAFSLQCNMDYMAHHGFLRAQGVGKGLSIKVPFPITHTMAEELAKAVLENIKFLYIRYQEKYTVQGSLDLGKV